MGRPSKYTPELVEEICERLSKGEPLAQICRDEGMPHVSTVARWGEGESEQARGISRRVAQAREYGFDALANEALQIVDSTPERVATKFGDQVDSGDVAYKKLRAETRLKLLACWDPKRYGNKVDLTSGDKPLQGNSIHITREVINGK